MHTKDTAMLIIGTTEKEQHLRPHLIFNCARGDAVIQVEWKYSWELLDYEVK